MYKFYSRYYVAYKHCSLNWWVGTYFDAVDTFITFATKLLSLWSSLWCVNQDLNNIMGSAGTGSIFWRPVISAQFVSVGFVWKEISITFFIINVKCSKFNQKTLCIEFSIKFLGLGNIFKFQMINRQLKRKKLRLSASPSLSLNGINRHSKQC